MTTRILTSRGGRLAGDDATSCHYHAEGMLASLGTFGSVGSLLGMRAMGP